MAKKPLICKNPDGKGGVCGQNLSESGVMVKAMSEPMLVPIAPEADSEGYTMYTTKVPDPFPSIAKNGKGCMNGQSVTCPACGRSVDAVRKMSVQVHLDD